MLQIEFYLLGKTESTLGRFQFFMSQDFLQKQVQKCQPINASDEVS